MARNDSETQGPAQTKAVGASLGLGCIRLSLWVVAAALAVQPARAQPVITVRPQDHEHTFYSGGSGYTLYYNHIVQGQPDATAEMIYDWLFGDLNNECLRWFVQEEGEAVNDNADPFTINWASMTFPRQDGLGEVFREAKERNPRTIIMMCPSAAPAFLQGADGHINYAYPNVWDEFAEYIFANMLNMKKNEGVQVDILDIINEPDWLGPGQTETEDRITELVWRLEALVAGPQNDCGLAMPILAAPSNLSAAAAKGWSEDWYNNKPAVWDNVDMVTCHPYHAGFDASNYAGISAVKGGRMFVENEMEFGHESFINNGDIPLPEDYVEDQLEASLALCRVFSMAVNNGAAYFCVFYGNSPQTGPKALVYTPWWNTPHRRKAYYAFKQLTTLQTYGSAVVSHDIASGYDGLEVVAYHHWGDDKAVVTVTNAKGTTQWTTLQVRDRHGELIAITRIADYATDATYDCTLLSDTAYEPAVTQHGFWLANHSVRTFVVHWQGSPEVSQDTFENGWTGGTGWGEAWAPAGGTAPVVMQFNKNHAAEMVWNGSITRSVSPARSGGRLRFLWDVDSLDSASETAVAQVYDGSWHTVWSVNNSANGSDSLESADNVPDNLQLASVDLRGYGPVTQLRFQVNATGGWDFFFVDNVELVSAAEAPAMVAGLTAVASTVPGVNTISLDWDDNADADLAAYNVYRSLTSGSGYALAAVGVPNSAYDDEDLDSETTWYYVVTAVDTSGNEGDPSDEAWATTGVSQWPYGGVAWALPGVIEGENYDEGGEGYAYHDTSAGNSGGVYRLDDVDVLAINDAGEPGYGVWTATGEWLEYTVNIMGGEYNADLRVASAVGGQTVRLLVDGGLVGTFTVPATGGITTFATATQGGLVLPAGAGERALRLEIVNGGVVVNRLGLWPVDGCAFAKDQPGWTPLPGDVNEDCVVDLVDLASLVGGWLSPYDLVDYGQLAGSWLAENAWP